jgi:hypothetical protein
MVYQMRVALRGHLIGYALVALAWLFALKIAPRLLPDLGMAGALVFVGGPFIILHGIALAIFCGSVFCASRALRRETASRTFGGFAVLALSVIPALLLGVLWLRGLVFTR